MRKSVFFHLCYFSLLSYFCVLFSVSAVSSEKIRAQNIARLDIPVGGYRLWGCLDGPCKITGTDKVTLVNTEAAYLKLRSVQDMYFFYEGLYSLDFKCSILFENEKVKDEVHRVQAYLKGGTVYKLSFAFSEPKCPPKIIETK